jgi:hypothetical protein
LSGILVYENDVNLVSFSIFAFLISSCLIALAKCLQKISTRKGVMRILNLPLIETKFLKQHGTGTKTDMKTSGTE